MSVVNNSEGRLLALVTHSWKFLKAEGLGSVLVRGAGGYFIIAVTGAVIAFGLNVLLARVMGVTQFGNYIYALTWINILSLVARLGMDTSIVRFVAAYNAQRNWSLLRGLLSLSFRYVLITSLVISGLTATVVLLQFDQIGFDLANVFLVAVLLLPILSLTGLRRTTLRAFKQIARSAATDSIIRPLLLAMMVVGLYLYTRDQLNPRHVMLLNFLATLVTFAIGSIWLIRAIPNDVYSSQPTYSGREWLRVSLPLLLMSGMHLILKQTDIIMIGFMLDTKQAGIYAVVSRISALVVFGLQSVNSISAPLISELYSTGRGESLQSMVTLAARGIFISTFFICICLVIFAKDLLGLFGGEFIVGYTALLFLLGGLMINALVGSVGFLMTMTGHQDHALLIVAASAVINISLNILLIPLMGLIGAAIATSVSMVLWNVAMLIYVLFKLRINPTVLAWNQ